MKADIQQKIAPFVPKQDKNFSAASTKKGESAIDSNGAKKKADFRDLLYNSNQETKLEREAKANGSFYKANTEADFLDQLQKRNEPVRIPKNNLDKDDFLKLFVTQLQNQDPLNPDDSAEMASKLAHFNSLEQMLNVNKTLDKMLSAQNNDRQLGLVDYVGKDITVGSGRIKLTNSKPSESSFYLAAPSAETKLQVRDAAGVLLFEKEIGSMPVGTHKLAWDGKDAEGKPVADGVYTYSIAAKSMDATEIPVSVSSRVKVLGVDLQDSSGSVFTDFGKVKLGDIKALGTTGFEEGARKQAEQAAAEAKKQAQAPTQAQADMPEEAQNATIAQPTVGEKLIPKNSSEGTKDSAATIKPTSNSSNTTNTRLNNQKETDFIAPGINSKPTPTSQMNQINEPMELPKAPIPENKNAIANATTPNH